MAYVSASDILVTTSAVSSVSMSFIGEYSVGDLIIAICTQDTGTTPIEASGWTELGTQQEVQGQRTAVFYKTSSSIPEEFQATGGNEEWVVTLLAVKEASSSPFNVYARSDSADSTSSFLNSTQVTTTVDNCLVIYACGFDGNRAIVPEPTDLVVIEKSAVPVGCAQFVAYKFLATAGPTPVVKMLSQQAAEGGSFFTIAIADKTPSTPARPPQITQGYSILYYLGGQVNPSATASSLSRNDSVSISALAIAPTTVLGLPVSAAAGNTSGAFVGGVYTACFLTSYVSGSYTSPAWAGSTISGFSLNLTNQIMSIELGVNSLVSTFLGQKGYLLHIEDSGGSWVAFNVSVAAGLVASSMERFFVHLGQTPPDDSYGQIDWASIVKISFAFHRSGSFAGTFYIRGLLLHKDPLIGVGGCADSPLTFNTFATQSAINYHQLALRQGSGQSQHRLRLQIGDGSSPTFFKAFSFSTEFPGKRSAALGTRYWLVPDGGVGVAVKAGPEDLIDFSGGMCTSKTRQVFQLDQTSSPSAEYKFDGFILSGFSVFLTAAGITVSGAFFSGCYEIDAVSSLSDCVITDSLASSAVLSTDPAKISKSTFTQGTAGGHAIEITQPGTFAFVGNTFEGYGLDGTTDAAIYNNSGGHVVLNVSGGGDTPTVRNGVGATTEVVAGAQITVIGLATGSQVKVTKVSNGDVLFNGPESLGEVSFSTTYIGAVRVEARKASASPFYKPWATQATTVSGQTVEVTALQELDE